MILYLLDRWAEVMVILVKEWPKRVRRRETSLWAIRGWRIKLVILLMTFSSQQ